MNPNGVRVKDPDTQRIQIELLAYFLWQNAGEPAGTADRDWFLAKHVVETGAVGPVSGPELDHCPQRASRGLGYG